MGLFSNKELELAQQSQKLQEKQFEAFTKAQRENTDAIERMQKEHSARLDAQKQQVELFKGMQVTSHKQQADYTDRILSTLGTEFYRREQQFASAMVAQNNRIDNAMQARSNDFTTLKDSFVKTLETQQHQHDKDREMQKYQMGTMKDSFVKTLETQQHQHDKNLEMQKYQMVTLKDSFDKTLETQKHQYDQSLQMQRDQMVTLKDSFDKTLETQKHQHDMSMEARSKDFNMTMEVRSSDFNKYLQTQKDQMANKDKQLDQALATKDHLFLTIIQMQKDEKEKELGARDKQYDEAKASYERQFDKALQLNAQQQDKAIQMLTKWQERELELKAMEIGALKKAVNGAGKSDVSKDGCNSARSMSSTVDGNTDADEKSMTCKLCKKNESNIMYLPCRHIVCCSSCTDLFKVCPECKGDIKSIRVVVLTESH